MYLLSLLNEEVSLYRQVKRSPQGGSNSRPLVYKTSALATELWRQAIIEATSIRKHLPKNTLNIWHGFYVIDEKLIQHKIPVCEKQYHMLSSLMRGK